jgi:hypothetical protein
MTYIEYKALQHNILINIIITYYYNRLKPKDMIIIIIYID